MRTLVDRLEPGELIPNGPFSYYGGRPESGIIKQMLFLFILFLKNDERHRVVFFLFWK